MKPNAIALALLMLGTGIGTSAHAADAARIAQLEAQMKQLQAQLEELKALAVADKERAEQKAVPVNETVIAGDIPISPRISQLSAPVEQKTVPANKVVTAGDIPGSIRMPESRTSVRIYGIAEVNAIQEFKASNGVDYSTFLPYQPLRGSAAARRSGNSYLHARTSRIGLETFTQTQYGPLIGRIETDFNNDPRTGNAALHGSMDNIYTQQQTNSYNLRLRLAYFQLGSWLFGQDWSTFMDMESTPETVDFNGPIGSTFIRQPMVRYTHVSPRHGNFIVALENPISYVMKPNPDNVLEVSSVGFSKTPYIILRWDRAYHWGHLNFRGVTHELRMNDGEGTNSATRGWGLSASGKIKTPCDDSFTWVLTGGEGIGRYFNYIEGALFDGGRVHKERALGLVVGYQHKVNDTLRMNFILGTQRNFNNSYTDLALYHGWGSSRNADQYALNRRLTQTHINAIWNPVRNVDLGIEYIWGRRETLSGEKGDLSRINFMARYHLN